MINNDENKKLRSLVRAVIPLIESLPEDCMGLEVDKRTGEAEFPWRDAWLEEAKKAIK